MANQFFYIVNQVRERTTLKEAVLITCGVVGCFFQILIFLLGDGDGDRIRRWTGSNGNPPPGEIREPPAVPYSPVQENEIRVGDRIIVMKAPSKLLIRSEPKKTARRIGHAKNHATGTVKAGPEVGPRNLTWYSIEWDKAHTIGWNRKVVFYRRDLGNQKWSVEKNEKGTRHLKKTE